MTQEIHFETGGKKRRKHTTALSDELVRQRTLHSEGKEKAQLFRTIGEFEHVLLILDEAIEFELNQSQTRNPVSGIFPMSARALIARRDNIKATVLLLQRRLNPQDMPTV